LQSNVLHYERLKSFLGVLTGIYDSFRLVDPISKMVYSVGSDGAVSECTDRCFEVWGRNKYCDNCISARALNEKATFVKVEEDRKLICMVTSVPTSVGGREMVLELVKAMPEGLYISRGPDSETIELYEFIDAVNASAVTDVLTNLYNRRYVDERLPSDIAAAREAGGEFSVVLIDIDRFKEINDNFGHPCGDTVLKRFGCLIGCAVKQTDGWAARWGGEEFLLGLPGAGIEQAVSFAEKLRKTFEGERIKAGNYAISATASFGAAELGEAERFDMPALMDIVDSRLYLAKHLGRNRVVPDKNSLAPDAAN
jgi:two-component system cell cycle response regulator